MQKDPVLWQWQAKGVVPVILIKGRHLAPSVGPSSWSHEAAQKQRVQHLRGVGVIAFVTWREAQYVTHLNAEIGVMLGGGPDGE